MNWRLSTGKEITVKFRQTFMALRTAGNYCRIWMECLDLQGRVHAKHTRTPKCPAYFLSDPFQIPTKMSALDWIICRPYHKMCAKSKIQLSMVSHDDVRFPGIPIVTGLKTPCARIDFIQYIKWSMHNRNPKSQVVINTLLIRLHRPNPDLARNVSHYA